MSKAASSPLCGSGPRALAQLGRGQRCGVFEDQAGWSGKRDVEKEGSDLGTPPPSPTPVEKRPNSQRWEGDGVGRVCS